mmetsp:Transcript_8102/g.21435  ORF Transcript_8102/g.21435 Transcript_8102/m.21435 type:complete len:231 (-) Transcript_8102:398-1090(-)
MSWLHRCIAVHLTVQKHKLPHTLICFFQCIHCELRLCKAATAYVEPRTIQRSFIECMLFVVIASQLSDAHTCTRSFSVATRLAFAHVYWHLCLMKQRKNHGLFDASDTSSRCATHTTAQFDRFSITSSDSAAPSAVVELAELSADALLPRARDLAAPALPLPALSRTPPDAFCRSDVRGTAGVALLQPTAVAHHHCAAVAGSRHTLDASKSPLRPRTLSCVRQSRTESAP